VSLPSPHPAPAATAVQNPLARVRAARTLSIVGMVFAIVAIPSVMFRLKSQTTVSSGGVTTTTHRSLIASHGWTVLLPFIALLVAAVVPVALLSTVHAQRARVWCAALFVIALALALITSGAFSPYIPSLILAIAAAWYGRSQTA
jgi:hypothetical protein